MSEEKPWTRLPIDIDLVPYCKQHNKRCVIKKIDDDIGYGYFCPDCEKEK